MVTDQWQPDQYHRFHAERSAPFFDLLGLVERDGLPVDGPRIVDLGCGTGELTAEAHRTLGARATLGIDRSEAMLEEARAYASPRLEFRLGDIGDFPGAPSSARFHVVISNAALQWLPDHESVLTRWSEGLRGGGQLAVQVPANSDHPSHVLANAIAREPPFVEVFAGSSDGGPPPDPVHNVLPPERYAALLHELGFTRQRVRLQVYGHLLASTTEVVEWVKGTNLTRFQAGLPPGLFERFLDVYRARLLDELGDHRPFFYTFKRVLLWGRR